MPDTLWTDLQAAACFADRFPLAHAARNLPPADRDRFAERAHWTRYRPYAR